MRKLFILLSLFGLCLSYAYAQGVDVFVDADKGVDGTDADRGESWDKPYKSIMYAIWSPKYQSGKTIYVKEGVYAEKPNDFQTTDGVSYGSSDDQRNLPRNKNIIIKAGFYKENTGTNTACGQNPGESINSRKTSITVSGNPQQGLFRSWYDPNTGNGSGNLFVQGLSFVNYTSWGIINGSIWSLGNDVKNKEFVFDNIEINNVQGGLYIGSFYLRGERSENNKFTLSNSRVRNNKDVVIKVIQGKGLNITLEGNIFSGNDVGQTTPTNKASVFVTDWLGETESIALTVRNNIFCENKKRVLGLHNVIGNSGKEGNAATVLIEGNKFYKNEGDIDFVTRNKTTLRNNSFVGQGIGTRYHTRGAAGYFENSILKSYNNIFTQYDVSVAGGAVYVKGFLPEDNSFPKALFSGDIFSENGVTGMGGALAIEESRGGENVVIENAQFIKNKISSGIVQKGAAIFIKNTNVRIINSKFFGNEITNGEGGAIYSEASLLAITGTSKDMSWFKDNKATLGGGAVFLYNPASSSANIFSADGSMGNAYKNVIHNTAFHNNSSSGVSENGGGAIAYRELGDNQTSLTDSDFFNNEINISGLTSQGGGGALVLRGSVLNNFSGNQFGNNKVNGSTSLTNAARQGSDIRTYFGSVKNISNSYMQLASQNSYIPSSEFTFGSGNQFGGTQGLAPANLETITAPLSCPVFDIETPLLEPCECYKDPILGTGATTKHGITALGRAGANNGNWPMVRESAHTVLEAKSKGFVINRVSKPQDVIANPADGMMVYDTDAKCLKIYVEISDTQKGWYCFDRLACPD